MRKKIMKNKTIELMDTLDALEDTKLIVERISRCKEELDSLLREELNDCQKLWLLAFEVCEARLAKNALDQNEDSKQRFLESLSVLNQAIVSGLLSRPRKKYRVTAQPLVGEGASKEYIVEAKNEEEAKDIGLKRMLEEESDGLLLDSPGQIFTAEETK